MHTALCPGSLGKMSSSKAISLVLHMCSVSYFGTSSLHFMWNTVSFMKFLTLSVDSQQKTLVFHQSSLKLVFHSGLSALGSAFSDTHLHGEHLRGCAQGTVQPGHMWGPPTCLGDACGHVSQLGLSVFSSKWQLLPSSYHFAPLSIIQALL